MNIIVFALLFVNFELSAADEKEVHPKVRLAYFVPGSGWSEGYDDSQKERMQKTLAESTLTTVKSLLEAIAEFRSCDVVFIDENGKPQCLGKNIPVSNLRFALSSSKQSIASFAERFFPQNCSEPATSEELQQFDVDSIHFCRGPFGSDDFHLNKDEDEQTEAARFLASHPPLPLYKIPELFNETNFLKHVHDFSYLRFIFTAMNHLLDDLAKRELKHTGALRSIDVYRFVTDESEGTTEEGSDDCVITVSENLNNALIIELGMMRAYREKFLAVLKQFYSHVRPLNGQFKDQFLETIMLADPLLGHQNPLMENITLYALGVSSSSGTQTVEQREISADQCCKILTEIHRWNCFYNCSYELMSTIHSFAKLFVWHGSKFEYRGLNSRGPNPKSVLGIAVKAVESDGSDDESEPAPSKKTAPKPKKKDTRSAKEIRQAQQAVTEAMAKALEDELQAEAARTKRKETKKEATQRKRLEEQQRQHEIAEEKRKKEESYGLTLEGKTAKPSVEKDIKGKSATAKKKTASSIPEEPQVESPKGIEEPQQTAFYEITLTDPSELISPPKSHKAIKREAAATKKALKTGFTVSQKPLVRLIEEVEKPDSTVFDSCLPIPPTPPLPGANLSGFTAPLSVDGALSSYRHDPYLWQWHA